MNPLPAGLLELQFFRVRGVAWQITPPPLPVLLIQRLVAPSLLLSPAGLRLGRSGVVTARSFPIPTFSCTRPCLPPLHVSAPPSSLPCPRLVLMFSLLCLLLVPWGLWCNIGPLPQTLASHAGAVGLTSLAFHSLARQREHAFTTGVGGRTVRL